MENNDNYFEELINALPYCVIINKPIQDKNGAITDFKAMYFSKNTENEYIINGAKSDYEKFIRTLINIDGTTLFDIFREVYKTGKIQVHGVRLDTNSRDIDDITYVCFLKYRNEIVTLWNSKAKVSQKEQAIFEEQAHGFNALISSSDAGIIVKDLLGRVLDWNVGAEIITGYERSEVIGKYSEIFPNTEEYERVLEVNKRIIRGERVGHQSFNLLHKSGRIINCSAVYSPVFNSSKVLTGIVVVFFDITDATEAQKQARNLAAIFKIADAGVVIKDNRGVITDWNIGAENIFGYEKNEVVGKNHRLLFALENIGESEDITKAINLGKHIAHFETSRLHKKGNIIECSASITPTYDEN